MAFQKKNWQFNDIISENELNRMEDGIEEGITKAEQAEQTAQQAAQTATQTVNELAAHKAEKMSELKYVERDLSLEGDQLVVFSKEPKILFINGIVENTNKISLGRRSQDGETAEGMVEDSKKWNKSIIHSVVFYDTNTDSTYANVEINNNNNVILKWQKDGNGATGTARLTLVAIFHE